MQRPILGPVLASLGVLLLLAGGHLLPDLFPPELETVRGRLHAVQVERAIESAAPTTPGPTQSAVLVRLHGRPEQFRLRLGWFGDPEELADRLSEGRWLELAVDRDGLEASRRAHAWYQQRTASATAGGQAQAADRARRAGVVLPGGTSAPVAAYEIRSGPTIIASRLAFEPGRTVLACLAFGLGSVALLAGFRFGACEDDA